MEKLDPKRTALMVMHTQKCIVKPGSFNYSGAPAQVQKYNTLDKIQKAIVSSRAAGVQVIYLNWCMKPGYPEVGGKFFQISPIMEKVFQQALK